MMKISRLSWNKLLLINLIFIFFLPLYLFAKQATTSIRVFFWNSSAPSQLETIIKKVPQSPIILHMALQTLLIGPSDSEKKQGLHTAFAPKDIINYNSECETKRDKGILKPLKDYYIGVNLTSNGTAVINFKKEALCYLQSTPAQSEKVMAPIEKTAKQFDTVKEVKYAIEGKIIDSWDA